MRRDPGWILASVGKLGIESFERNRVQSRGGEGASELTPEQRMDSCSQTTVQRRFAQNHAVAQADALI